MCSLKQRPLKSSSSSYSSAPLLQSPQPPFLCLPDSQLDSLLHKELNPPPTTLHLCSSVACMKGPSIQRRPVALTGIFQTLQPPLGLGVPWCPLVSTGIL